MKRILGISFLLMAIAWPAIAQWQQWRLSSDDQQRFDSYYSRWQESRQRNDRDEVMSMERRMYDVYARYRIPMQTPFWRVASNARSERDQWHRRLSTRDQERFDSYFSRWQEYRQRRDREQMASMEKRMQDVYAHYNIPSNTPYFWVASNTRDEDWDRWENERWRGRLSADDQRRFDSYFSRWQEYRRTNNREQMISMEKRMQDLMDHYNIPQQIPFEQITSENVSY